MDIYLRAGTEAALDAALALIEGAAMDRIGIIIRHTDEGPITLPGWHANIRFSDSPPPDLLADLDGLLIPTPENPYRIWM
jgi:hypothetical protein